MLKVAKFLSLQIEVELAVHKYEAKPETKAVTPEWYPANSWAWQGEQL